MKPEIKQHDEKSAKQADLRPTSASVYGLNAASAWKTPENDPETLRRYANDRMRHFALR